jgi:hypothetical protein
LFHELHHLVRSQANVDRDVVGDAIREGMATAFERDFAGAQPPWGQYPNDVDAWTRELLTLSGAAGWTVALALRGPVAWVARRLCIPYAAGRLLLGCASGPLEEGVRLAMALRWLRAAADCVSFGLGWGLVEVVYVCVNALLWLSQGPKWQGASRRMLTRDGGKHGRLLVLSVTERAQALCFHLGATLLIARHAWAVALLACLHSGTNVVALLSESRAVKTAVLLTSSALTFATGLLAWHP